MRTRPTIIAFGLHGLWHRCEQPEHFQILQDYGFRRVDYSYRRARVEACVTSGIPAKAVNAGVYDWPEYPPPAPSTNGESK